MDNKQENTYKNIYRIMLVVMAAVILPIWYLGRFQVLNLDDFYFGAMTHHAWIRTHSPAEVIKAACEQVRFYFFAKQATYSSVFLMSVFPGVWARNMYFPVPIILSSMIIASVSVLTHTVMSDCMGIRDRYRTGIVSIILVFVIIQTLPVPLEALYWYNGALHYVFMESVMFFEIACILHGIRTTDRVTVIWTTVVASVLGIIVGGGNLVTGLQACILIVLHVAVHIYGRISGRNENKMWFLIPELITVAGYLVNITAPGNAERQADSVMMNPIKAIFMSFYWGAAHGISWLSPMSVIGITVIIVVMAALAKDCKGHFFHPGLTAVISICIFAAMFTPTFYAMSEDAPSRVQNIIYIAEFVLIFVNIANDIGYLYMSDKCENRCGKFFRSLFDLTGNALPGIITAGGAAILIVFVFCADKNEFVTISAIRSIMNGEASRYYEQSMERLEILYDEDQPDAVIYGYTEDAKPYLLFKQDVSTAEGEEGYWQNIEMSNYFEKDSITVVSP
ncbi:MAG: DUF6056 family protein [Lachnospiraceae bacterium]|nr:DUF6056 family protein [Lachnospiraceae bacterium]